MRNVQRYAVLVLAAASLAACGDDDKSGTGPDGTGLGGTFSATLAGDIAGALSGGAGHAAVSTGPVEEQGFVMAFEDTPSGSTVTASIIFARQNPAMPSLGQYNFKDADEDGVEIGDDDYTMIAAVTDAQGVDWVCASNGGSMTFTESSSSRIRGTLAITASCFTGGSETLKDVTLSGNFDSRRESVPQLRAMVAWNR